MGGYTDPSNSDNQNDDGGGLVWKEGRKEGTCLFDIDTKHNTEIYIGKIISGDSH